MVPSDSTSAAALARLYDLDLAQDPGDLDLYLALARRTEGPIVELCAGTGRVAVPLAAAGHTVTAVDVDPAMIARGERRARDAGPGVADRVTYVAGDLHHVAIPGTGGFRLGIIALNSLLLLGGPRQQRQAIAVLADLLVPGGIAVVDVWLPLTEDLVRFDGRLGLEWVRTDAETGRSVAKLAAARYDSATRALALTTIFDEAEPGGPVRRWIRDDAFDLTSASELRLHAEDAGLEVEVIAGDYGLTPLEAGDGRAVLVARKPNPS